MALLGLGGALSVVRAVRLVEPPAPRPGAEVEAILEFARQTIPRYAGYMYVQPTAFGSDSGAAPRLRYELFPRRYDNVRSTVDETTVRNQMNSSGLTYIVVPDARQYPDAHWLRQSRDWLTRNELDANRYILEVTA